LLHQTKLNKQIIKTHSRAILNYCLRVLIFLGLCNFEFVPLTIINICDFIFSPIVDIITKTYQIDMFAFMILDFILKKFAILYFLAKIAGIFKKLDKLNFFLSLGIIFIVGVILNYSEMVQIQLNPFKIGFEQKTIIHILPFVFLLYKLLESLTKIFPVPFKKIGYVCSIEFFRDLAKKIKRK